jgi:hypothetical protein
MMISYYLGNKYYPIPYDLKKIEGISAIDTFFSRIFYGFRENYYVGVGLLIVSLFYLSQ